MARLQSKAAPLRLSRWRPRTPPRTRPPQHRVSKVVFELSKQVLPFSDACVATASGPFIEALSFPGAPWLKSPAVEKPADVTPDIVKLLKDKAQAAKLILGALL